MEFSDEYLLQKYLDADIAAFNILIQRWQKRIFNFIYRNIGDYEEARDLTQDTFAKTFLKVKDLDDRSRFGPWLYRVALNECRMAFRRSRGKQKVPLEIYQQTDAEEIQLRSVMSEEPDGPEEQLRKKENVERLRAVLQMIPEEQRLVILMKEYESLKFQEIAEVLDVPLSTVKSRMYLGLKTLKRLLLQRELTRK